MMTEFEMMVEMLTRLNNVVDYEIDYEKKIIDLSGRYSEGSTFYFDDNGKVIDIR